MHRSGLFLRKHGAVCISVHGSQLFSVRGSGLCPCLRACLRPGRAGSAGVLPTRLIYDAQVLAQVRITLASSSIDEEAFLGSNSQPADQGADALSIRPQGQWTDLWARMKTSICTSWTILSSLGLFEQIMIIIGNNMFPKHFYMLSADLWPAPPPFFPVGMICKSIV